MKKSETQYSHFYDMRLIYRGESCPVTLTVSWHMRDQLHCFTHSFLNYSWSHCFQVVIPSRVHTLVHFEGNHFIHFPHSSLMLSIVLSVFRFILHERFYIFSITLHCPCNHVGTRRAHWREPKFPNPHYRSQSVLLKAHQPRRGSLSRSIAARRGWRTPRRAACRPRR